MKTPVTMRLEDEIIAKAKEEALRRKTTLTRVVEDALQRLFAEQSAPLDDVFVIKPFHPDVPGYAPGIPPGTLPSQILAMMDEEDDLHRFGRAQE